jgi:hypothetical protein
MSSSHPPPQNPFEPYRHPFDSSSRRDTNNNDPPQRWNSGDNNSNSPLGNHQDMDIGSGNDMGGTHRTQHHHHPSQRVVAREPKKKRFVCPHCTRTFARSGHLQRHERSRNPFPSSNF